MLKGISGMQLRCLCCSKVELLFSQRAEEASFRNHMSRSEVIDSLEALSTESFYES